MSKKIVLSADGNTATVADATLGDVITSAFTTNTFVSGNYGLLQTVLKLGAGATLEYLFQPVGKTVSLFRR